MRVCVIALATLWVAIGAARADAPEAWNRFRGPNGQGVVRVKRVPRQMGRTLWKASLPPGISSPIVMPDGAVLVTGVEDGRIVLVCLDPRTGKRRWARPAPEADLAKEGVHVESSAAASTPATDGRTVVVFVPGYGLWATDATGKERWRLPLPQGPNLHGKASSPVLHDGRVLQLLDSRRMGAASLCAVDLRTGKLLWQTVRREVAESWSTPVLWQGEGRTELLVFGPLLESYDPRTGKRLWAIPGFGEQPITLPVVDGDTLFVNTNGYGGFLNVGLVPDWPEIVPRHDTNGDGQLSLAEMDGGVRYLLRREFSADLPWNNLPASPFFGEMDTDRDKRVSRAEWDAFWASGARSRVAAYRRASGSQAAPERIWESLRGVSEVPSPLKVGARLFTVRDGGRLTCFDAATGTVRFEERLAGAGGQYVASPVAFLAGEKAAILVASARGVVTLVEAADALSVLATLDMKASVKATPAVDPARGRLYLRAGDALHAIAF